jgi:hypothetical protein
LPNGSDVKFPSETRGNQPFLERLSRLDEELVLAGTGGKLTMLAESGSGTLAGNAQADGFADIAAAEALEISEVFQKQFDALDAAELSERTGCRLEVSSQDLVSAVPAEPLPNRAWNSLKTLSNCGQPGHPFYGN